MKPNTQEFRNLVHMNLSIAVAQVSHFLKMSLIKSIMESNLVINQKLILVFIGRNLVIQIATLAMNSVNL